MAHDEDAAIEIAFQEAIGTRGLPAYITLGDRRGTENLPPEDLRRVTFEIGYRRSAKDSRRRGAQAANRKRTAKADRRLTRFAKWCRRHPRLSEKAAAQAFLVETDKSWHAGTDEERKRKVDSLTRGARRQRESADRR
jgi:hypothetical protein